jgi:transposase
MWTADRVRPIVTMTGSHQRTCVFGTLCIDRRQFFRQYESFNQYTFLDYLKQVQKKFRKLILFIDRARQHHRSTMVKKYMKQNKGVLKVIYFPRASPEFNAIEE